MTPFKNIGLVGRPGHDGVVDSLERILDYLARRGLTSVLDFQTAGLANNRGDSHCDSDALADRSDLVIVVGGDGSMLHVAKTIAEAQIPVIGINRGKLGFLTDIPPSKIEDGLEEVLNGNFSVDRRFMLAASKREENGTERALGMALNDIVLHPGNAAQMIEFELFVDGRFVYSLASDGLIELHLQALQRIRSPLAGQLCTQHSTRSCWSQCIRIALTADPSWSMATVRLSLLLLQQKTSARKLAVTVRKCLRRKRVTKS